MSCADCLEQQRILIRLTTALHDREQQYQELGVKFRNYKLQSKARLTQITHNIVDSAAGQESNGPTNISDILARLDESNDHVVRYREQNEVFKEQLSIKDETLAAKERQIQELEKAIQRFNGGKAASTENESIFSDRFSSSAEESNKNRGIAGEILAESTENQFYAQIKYKDSKIVELSHLVDEKDKQIMDLQESTKERDEVNKAKAKAIQILQEHLGKFTKKKFCDRSTETDCKDQSGQIISVDTDAAAHAPGGAVAFYKENMKRDDECSSYTTDFTATESNIDVTNAQPFIENKTMDKLNSRLSGLLLQVESMQQRVTKQDNFEQVLDNTNNMPLVDELPPVKKKREKRVKFDFGGDEHVAKIAELEEILQKTELACSDLKEENDELRLTIADLERRLDESSTRNTSLEGDVEALNRQLASVEETLSETKKRFEEASKENKNAALKAKAQAASKIRELDEILAEKVKILNEKSESLSALEKSHSDLSTELNQCLRIKDQLEKDLIESTSTNNKLETELIDSKNRLSSSLAEYSNLLEQLNLAKEQFEDFKSNSDKLIQEMESEFDESTKRSEDQRKAEKDQFEEKLRNLERHLGELKSQNADLASRLEKSIIDREYLNERYESVLKDVNQLRESIEVSNEFIDLLETDLDSSYAEKEHLRRQLQSKDLLRETIEYKLKFKAYLAKMQALQRDNERLEDELTKAVLESEKAKNDKFLIDQDIEALKMALDKERDKNKRAETNFKQISSTCEQSNQDSKAWLTKIDELRLALECKESELQSYMDKVKDREGQIVALKQQLDVKTDECSTNQKQLDGLMEEKADIENEIQNLWQTDSTNKKRLAEFENLYERAVDDKGLLRGTLDEERKANIDLKQRLSDLGNLAAENTQLKEKVAFFEQLNDQQSAMELSNKVVETSASLKNAMESCEKLATTLKQLNEDKSGLQEELSRANKIICDEREEKLNAIQCLEQKSGECADREAQISELTRKLEADHQSLLECIDKSDRQISELKQALELAENDRNSLEIELTGLRLEFNSLEIKNNELNNELIGIRNGESDSLKELSENLEGVRAENTQLLEKLEQNQEIIDKLNLQISDLEADRSIKLAESEFKIDSLSDQLILAEKNLLETQMSLTREREEHASNLKSSQKSFQDAQNNFEIEKRAHESELIQLKSLVDQLRAENQTILDSLASSKAEIDRLSLLCQETALEKEENLAIERLSNQKSLEDARNNFEIEKKALESELNQSKSLIDQLRVENQAILDSLASSRAEIDRLGLLCQEAVSEKENLAIERQTLRKEIADLNDRLSKLDWPKDQVADPNPHSSNSNDVDESCVEKQAVSLPAQNFPNAGNLPTENSNVLSWEKAYNQLVGFYNELQNAYALLYSQYEAIQVTSQSGAGFSDRNNVSISNGDRTALIDNNFVPAPDLLESIQLDAPFDNRLQTESFVERTVNSGAFSHLSSDFVDSCATPSYFDMHPQDEAGLSELIDRACGVLNVEFGKNQLSRFSFAEKLTRIVNEIRKLLHGNEELEKRCQSLSNEVNGYLQHITVLSKEVDDYRRLMKETSETDGKFRQLSENLQRRLDEAQNDQILLREENQNLRQLCQNFDQTKQQFERENEALKAEKENLAQLAESLQNALMAKSAELLNFENLNQENQSDSNARINKLAAELDSCKSYIESLEERIRATSQADLRDLPEQRNAEGAEKIDSVSIIDETVRIGSQNDESYAPESFGETYLTNENIGDTPADFSWSGKYDLLEKEFKELAETLSVISDEKTKIADIVQNLKNSLRIAEKTDFEGSQDSLKISAVDDLLEIQAYCTQLLPSAQQNDRETKTGVLDDSSDHSRITTSADSQIESCLNDGNDANLARISFLQNQCNTKDQIIEKLNAKLVSYESPIAPLKEQIHQEIQTSNPGVSPKKVSSSTNCPAITASVDCQTEDGPENTTNRVVNNENCDNLTSRINFLQDQCDTKDHVIQKLNAKLLDYKSLIDGSVINLQKLKQAQLDWNERLNSCVSDWINRLDGKLWKMDEMVELFETLRENVEHVMIEKQLKSDNAESDQDLPSGDSNQELRLNLANLQQQINRMQNDGSQMGAINYELNTRVLSLNRELSVLRPENEQLRNQLGALQHQHANCETKLDDYGRGIIDLKVQVGDLLSQMKQFEPKAVELPNFVEGSSADEANRKIKALELDKLRLCGNLSSLEKELTDAQSFSLGLERQSFALIEENDVLSAEKESHLKLIEELEQRENNELALATKTDALISELRDKSNDFSRIKDELDQSKVRLTECCNEAMQSEAIINDLQLKLADFENNKNELDLAKIESAKISSGAWQHSETKNAQLKNRSSQCDLDEKLQEENKRLMLLVSELESKFLANNRQMMDLSNSMQNNDLLNELESDNAKLKQEILSLKDENEQLTCGTKSVADEFRRVKLEYGNRIMELIEDAKAMTEENSRLLRSAKDKDRECTKYIETIHDLKVELIERRKICDGLQATAEKLEETRNLNARLERDLDDARNQLRDKEGECKSLRMMIDDLKKDRKKNVQTTDEMRSASQEAKQLIAMLEQERLNHSKSFLELVELKGQLSVSERQIENYRVKSLDVESIRSKVKDLQLRLDRTLVENERLRNQLSALENQKLIIEPDIDIIAKIDRRQQKKLKKLNVMVAGGPNLIGPLEMSSPVDLNAESVESVSICTETKFYQSDILAESSSDHIVRRRPHRVE